MSDAPIRLSRPRPILRSGAIAREALAHDGDVEVIAVFERSFYLACPHGIVCMGGPTIGAGPINVEVAGLSEQDWAAFGIGTGIEGRSENGTIAIGPALSLDAASGETWFPPPMPAWTPRQVRAGVGALRAAATAQLPADGLSALVLDGRPGRPRSTAATMAAGPVADLSRELPRALAGGYWSRSAIASATLLVGLGPGATPSGDDLLGGLMLALTAGGKMRLRDELWHALEGELDALTTPMSAMHFAAAADGMALAPVHTLIDAVLIGDAQRVGVALDAVGRIGHTSGWDAVAGIALGLDAILSARS